MIIMKNNQKFKIIFWDLDGTLISLVIAEKNGIKNALYEIGLGNIYSDKLFNDYHLINKHCWEKLETKDMTLDEVYHARFRYLFDKYNINYDTLEFNKIYQKHMSNAVCEIDNSIQLLNELKPYVKQYITTNGTIEVQSNKIRIGGFDKIVDGIFISEETGHNKPDIRFFQYVLDHINEKVALDEILMVGDSQTSDMTGANNIGIKSCYVNRENEKIKDTVHIDYCIDNIWEVKNIILNT